VIPVVTLFGASIAMACILPMTENAVTGTRSRRRMRGVILSFLALLLLCKHGRVRVHERVHSLVHREGECRLGGRLEGRRESSALGREYDRPSRSLITSIKRVELII
jgi:hypothetical protein